MLALMLMMPLLCVYADLLGMLAGLLIGTVLLDLSAVEYINETRKAVHLIDLGLGLGKSVVFGALMALAGCLRGMQCGQCLCVRPPRPPRWSRALSGHRRRWAVCGPDRSTRSLMSQKEPYEYLHRHRALRSKT